MLSGDGVYRRRHPLWRMMSQPLQSCLCSGWQVLPKLLDDAGRKVIWPECTHRLQRDTRGITSPQQSPRPGVLEMNDLISDRNLSGAAINQIDHLGRYL